MKTAEQIKNKTRAFSVGPTASPQWGNKQLKDYKRIPWIKSAPGEIVFINKKEIGNRNKKECLFQRGPARGENNNADRRIPREAILRLLRKIKSFTKSR